MTEGATTAATDPRLEEARRHVADLRGFYINLITFVVVGLGLLAINLITSPHSLWFFWPLIFWAFGLAAHAYGVFANKGFLNEDWEQRKVQEYMRDQE